MFFLIFSIFPVKFSKPILTVSSAVVSWGQEIWFVCSVQPQILGGTFILMNDKRSYRKTPPSGSKSTNFIIYKADIDHEGSYQCRFQKRGPHQNFSSPVSNSVRVSVTVRLQIPKISLSSPGRGLGSKEILITRGDNFTFTCSINSQYPQGLFFLVFSGSNMTSNISAVNNAASFTFPAAELEHQGSYSCVYQITLAGRTFTSAESAPISIGVQLSLQIPNISITFPGAELVRGPGVVDVTRGHSFTITCSVNSKSLQNQFYLIFSGSNMTNSNSSVNNSASFTFPVADFEHQGNYSCVYQVTLSGRTFTSAESAPITVAVKQSLLLQTYAVFGGILLLLLFVLFLVCLIYRKRKLPAVLFQRFTREDDGNCEIKYENSSEENLL
ncbi:uncharacterized protein LOC112151263 [Oryzias melastigma]|uniref:uncharacterized protein LOC112151263 n=1 Tax=Oryzias melastigma TaxID=30732 RepID=UPI00168D360A|nr:uncharacterized protein LOC112151263 [Oryzias melastigma]